MKYILLIFGLFCLSACGFEPIYGEHSTSADPAVESRLAQVDIGNIPDREGQYLRNQLIDRFYRKDGRPMDAAYRLDVSGINERKTNLDITKSSDATRGQLSLDTKITLISKTSGQVLMERELRSVTSYNILSSEFSTRVSEDNARLNALNDIARQIELQLSLYFKR